MSFKPTLQQIKLYYPNPTLAFWAYYNLPKLNDEDSKIINTVLRSKNIQRIYEFIYFNIHRDKIEIINNTMRIAIYIHLDTQKLTFEQLAGIHSIYFSMIDYNFPPTFSIFPKLKYLYLTNVSYIPTLSIPKLEILTIVNDISDVVYFEKLNLSTLIELNLHCILDRIPLIEDNNVELLNFKLHPYVNLINLSTYKRLKKLIVNCFNFHNYDISEAYLYNYVSRDIEIEIRDI